MSANDLTGKVRNEFSVRTGSSMFDYSDIANQTITLDDLIRPLSKNTRFNGHTSIDMTVLQHSFFIATICYGETNNPMLTLACLVHDFHEALVTDIPTPLKRYFKKRFPGFDLESITDEMDEMICRNLAIEFVLPYLKTDELKYYDRLSVYNELAYHFVPGFVVDGITDEYFDYLDIVSSMTPEDTIEQFTQFYHSIVDQTFDTIPGLPQLETV
jgi:hypothetical protein